MIIDWYGHSCFVITIENGTRILFDPYDEKVGYPPQKISADIVVISHDHHDHNDLSRVEGKYKVVNTCGMHDFKDFNIESMKTWHDKSEGSLRGENLVSVLNADSLSICHMGDIGCIPSEELYKKIEGVDILMIPVGGNFTIDANEALKICERVSPNIIIPMHFKTEFTSMKIATVDDFLEAAAQEYDVSHPGKSHMEIDKDNLKKRTRIVVMECI